MKMDVDCIRDILLQAEENGFTVYQDSSDDDIGETETISEFPFIEKYDNEKLLYHIELADEFGLLKTVQCIGCSSVMDLSAQGHLFLADIREDNIWNKTKEVSKQVGVSSIDAVKQIAINVASSLITNYFQK
ncbi:DUF2513 domain-containing protein [Fusobacterium varium]|jgi:hypothetical protein